MKIVIFLIFLLIVIVVSSVTKKPGWFKSKVSSAKDWAKSHRPRWSSKSDGKDKSWSRNMIDKAKSKVFGEKKNTGGSPSISSSGTGHSGVGGSYPKQHGGFPAQNGGGGHQPNSRGQTGGSYPKNQGGYPANNGGGQNSNSHGQSGGSYPKNQGYPVNNGGGIHSNIGGYPAQNGGYPIQNPIQPFGNSITKKPSFFERAKQKVKSSGIVGKAIGFVKKDLGIGVVGPKQPSKILKYGGKAFEKLLGKKKVAAGAGIGGAAGYVAGSNLNNYDGNQNPQEYVGGAIRGALQKQISVVEEEVDEIQNEFQASWNVSEAGSRYKIFEQPILNWEDAQEFCYNHGANLAVIDSDSKNQFVKELLLETEFNTTQVLWFGLHTEISTGTGDNQKKDEKGKTFSNFQAESIPGCGVVDLNGVWSISSCSLQLPFICQAIKLNGEVFIP
ncbi:unnamed protein product [Caenorhabditis angaria]|uniref:C-type lectin domain-containing protein n=1 Tax=Caenorhabditis angaria TaxID=860376 RepID=A0A9P1MWP7_9PELO|nr:unnamed protein product [Caenorhabditis angaria]